jgi:outer membrane biosynthesis protein TonB
MKHPIFNRITLPVALLAVGAFCPNVHAGWGSLQGNNRSAPAQSAPRQQPQINHAPQPQIREPAPVARPEPQPAFHPQPQPEVRPEQVREPQPVTRPEATRKEIQPAVRVQPQDGHSSVSVDQARAGEADRRRMAIDTDRSQSFFWSDYHRGMRVDRLPDGYRRFRFRDHDYYF